MKVSELINRLRSMPQDAEVMAWLPGQYIELHGAFSTDDKKQTMLEGSGVWADPKKKRPYLG